MSSNYESSKIVGKTKGISIYALKHSWLKEAIEAGFEESTPLKEAENRDHIGISRKRGEDVICPKDGKLGAAYVDCLRGDDNVGPANLFVSYCYEYTIGDIVDTLYLYCKINKQDPKSTYVWIFFCCMNLYREYDRTAKGIQVSTEDFLKEFLESLSEIKNTLCLVFPWKKPFFLKVPWCIIELYTATTIEDGTVSILMPPNQIDDMFQEFRGNFGDVNMVSSLFADWAKQTEGTSVGSRSDQESILKLIHVNGGLETIHDKANELMRKFVQDMFLRRTLEWINDAETQLVLNKDSSILLEEEDLPQQSFSDETKTTTAEEEDIPKGVSVHWLKYGFLEEVKQAGLSETATIYEIENLQSPTFGIIRSKGETIVCPRDGEVGAAYVDCLCGEDNVGPSNIMLSYSWGNTIGDIVDTLCGYCYDNGFDPKDIKVWICCLCNNQHRINTHLPSETFRVTFRNRVMIIGHIIALMSPWKNPIYLTRVWCVFELFTAYENGCRISIAMPPRERKDVVRYIGNTTALYEAFIGGKVEDAKATFEEDRNTILDIVRRGSGFDKLNNVVNGMFRKWIKETIIADLKKWFTLAGEKYHEEHYIGARSDIYRIC